MPVPWYVPSAETSAKFEEFMRSFGSEESVREVLVRPGNRMFFFRKGEFGSQETLGFTSEEIQRVSLMLMAEKAESQESVAEAAGKWNERGHFNFSFIREGSPYRAHWSRSMGEDSLQIRKIPKTAPTPALLGVPERVAEAMSDFRRWGLVVVSAPTWNGKSTTIASVLQEFFDKECVNAVTLEDPIEYVYSQGKSSVRQREIWFDADSYETGIEAGMRQTPQIFVIQEMTTDDVIRNAMSLAKRWCLVVSTLHTPDVVTAFQRILDAYTDQQKPQILQDLKNYFRCFVSQRLVPKADGSGVTAVFEALTSNEESRGIVAEGAFAQLSNVLIRPGQTHFADSFAEKVASGDIEESVAIAYCPESSRRRLQSLLQSA